MKSGGDQRPEKDEREALIFERNHLVAIAGLRWSSEAKMVVVLVLRVIEHEREGDKIRDEEEGEDAWRSTCGGGWMFAGENKTNSKVLEGMLLMGAVGFWLLGIL